MLKNAIPPLVSIFGIYALMQIIRFILKRRVICPVCFSLTATWILGLTTGFISMPFILFLAGMSAVDLADNIRNAMKENQTKGYEYARAGIIYALAAVGILLISLIGK